MPDPQRVRQFIAVVEEHRYVDALRDFYHDDATMQENLLPPRVGLANLIANEERALETRQSIRTLPGTKWSVNGDHVAINWVFDLVDMAGRTRRLEEVSIQRWRGDRIAEERFYYDPVQFGSKPAQNRATLETLFEALARGDTRPLVDALADDVRWEVTGTSRWSRTYEGKRAVLQEFLGPIMAQFATEYRNVPRRMTAEGDYIVVQCRGEVTTHGGRPYNNEYCWVFRLDGGRIKEVTEYMDTKLAEGVLR